VPAMKIFPNPATDYVTIESNPGSNVSISDLAGKQIFEANNEDGSLKINTQEFEKGVYFVRVESNGNSRTMKLLIVQ
jgi:hypothetical protein